MTTSAAIAACKLRDRLSGVNPPSPLADSIVAPPKLVVTPSAEEAERLASALRAAGDADGPPCVALDDTVALADAVGALRNGDSVVLLDAAHYCAGDLAEQGLVVRLKTSPYPHRNVVEYLAHLGASGVPGDVLGGFAWQLLDDAETAQRADLRPTGHPDAPRIGLSSPIPAVWRPIPPGALSIAPPLRQWLLRHRTRDGQPAPPGEGDGILACGIVGLLASAGGVGKSYLAAQLAVSVATGRPWLGEFVIDRAQVGKRVLLACAEEDTAEIHRRLYAVWRALDLTADELVLVEQRVQVLGLAGHDCGLLARRSGGGLDETPVASSLRRCLSRNAGAEGWGLIVLDPLSRWAGDAAIDVNNGEATLVLAVCESLTTVPGAPVVLLPVHTSKASRRDGKAETRGASGLDDGARWVGTLRMQGEHVELLQAKSNYSRPWTAPVRLARMAGGPLRAVTADEQQAAESTAVDSQRREIEVLADKAVEILREIGAAKTRDQLASMLGVKLQKARAAVALALSTSRIVNAGTVRDPRFVVSDSVCVRDPHTPVDVGRRASADASTTTNVGGCADRDVEGTSRGRRDVDE